MTSLLASGGLIVDEGMLLATAFDLMVEKRVDSVDAYLAVRARLPGAPVASLDRDVDGLGVERDRVAVEAGPTR